MIQLAAKLWVWLAMYFWMTRSFTYSNASGANMDSTGMRSGMLLHMPIHAMQAACNSGCGSCKHQFCGSDVSS